MPAVGLVPAASESAEVAKAIAIVGKCFIVSKARR